MQICTALHSTAEHNFTVEHIAATTTGGQTWLVPTEHPNLAGTGRKPVDLSSRIEPWASSVAPHEEILQRKDTETIANILILTSCRND